MVVGAISNVLHNLLVVFVSGVTAYVSKMHIAEMIQMSLQETIIFKIKSLRPSYAIWRYKSGPANGLLADGTKTLSKLTLIYHQWFLWYSHESNFPANINYINPSDELNDYISKITSLSFGDNQVNITKIDAQIRRWKWEFYAALLDLFSHRPGHSKWTHFWDWLEMGIIWLPSNL